MTQPKPTQPEKANAKALSQVNTASSAPKITVSIAKKVPHMPMEITNKSELLDLFSVPEMPINNKVDADSIRSVAEQRLSLYCAQHERTRQLYMADTELRPTYLIQSLKSQFVEYQHYKMSAELDKRGINEVSSVHRLWQQLHVVDDLIEDIVRHMPAQMPVGWQLTSQGRNYLCLPTVGRLRIDKPVADQGSLTSYVLGHFGVASYTYDRGYFIGHVVGYLFCCYYFAHQSITYGVTSLSEKTVQGFDYVSLQTPQLVRLLQGLDVYCKKRIYQLAVICARLSQYATDKRIEKMLIAEVNEFDKTLQQRHLDVLLTQGIMPDVSEATPSS